LNSALRTIFWGYFFIFFRLDVVIDLFADPIGYLLIYSGCAKLVDAYPQAKKAMGIGLIGIFVSIPSVFVNITDPILPFGWAVYGNALIIPKLIIAYYLFVVLINVVNVFGNQNLLNRTSTTFTFFIVIYLLTLAFQSISMNVSGDGWLAISIISTIGVIFMDILFLFLIGAIRRVSPEDHRMNYSI
jgi:hypothetical protein